MDKKGSDEKKTNKQVSFDFLETFPFHSSPFRTIMCVCARLGCRTVWMRSQRRCLHLMLKQSRSSRAASSSGRSHLDRKTQPRSGPWKETRLIGVGGRLLPSIKNSLSICLTQFYAFSTFAMQLNELEKSTEGVVPPTDSRLRPDIRALEIGDIGSLSASHFSRIWKISWAGWLRFYMRSHCYRVGECREEKTGGKATHGPEKSLQVDRGLENQASQPVLLGLYLDVF